MITCCTVRGTALAAIAALAALFIGTAGDVPDALARTKTEANGKQKAGAAHSGYLKLIVSLKRQRITAYDAAGKVAEAPISSGQRGFATPTGIFTILNKRRMHYSNLYHSAPMPYMQRLTWSGVALHAGVLPGYPASHGCIRLPHSFARSLYGMTKVGTRVIVAHDDLEPVRIVSDKLFAPLPPDDSAPLSTGLAPEVPPTPLVRTAHEETGSMAPGASNTPAAAALAAVAQPQRTRESVAAERAQRLADLTAAVPAAMASRDAARETLEEAKRALEAARENVRQSNELADDIERRVNDARKREASAKTELEKLMERNKDADEAKMDELERREEALEVDILNGADEAARLESELRAVLARGEVVDAALRTAEGVREAARERLKQAEAAFAEAETALAEFKQEEKRRGLPITVFVSGKTGRIYVRQGYVNILDLPVTIAQPEAPLGTHVFTAHEFGPGERSLVWSVVSIPKAASRDSRSRSARGRSKEQEDVEAHTLPASPEMALSRIDIPKEAQDLIAELVRPGASLIVSDLGASHETNKYTDFILLTR